MTDPKTVATAGDKPVAWTSQKELAAIADGQSALMSPIQMGHFNIPLYAKEGAPPKVGTAAPGGAEREMTRDEFGNLDRAFKKAMEGRQYGREETEDARAWFTAGWRSLRAVAPPDRPEGGDRDGELWSFLRMVMAKGANIGVDFNTGKLTYEQHSAHLDAEAAYFAQQLSASRLSSQPVREAQGGGGVDELQQRLFADDGLEGDALAKHYGAVAADAIAALRAVAEQPAAPGGGECEHHWELETAGASIDLDRCSKCGAYREVNRSAPAPQPAEVWLHADANGDLRGTDAEGIRSGGPVYRVAPQPAAAPAGDPEPVACRTCNGTGTVEAHKSGTECSVCRGSGVYIYAAAPPRAPAGDEKLGRDRPVTTSSAVGVIVAAEAIVPPFEQFCRALQADFAWAWSWHCNLAMLAQDAGAPHREANERAADFMERAFGVKVNDSAEFKALMERTK